MKDDQNRDVTWKNYYATMFADSAATAHGYIRRDIEWDRLTAQTMDFRDVLHGASLDPAVIDAASANAVCAQIADGACAWTDGAFYGWEGVHETAGSAAKGTLYACVELRVRAVLSVPVAGALHPGFGMSGTAYGTPPAGCASG